MATDNDMRSLRKKAARAGKLERQLEQALEENYMLRRAGIRVGETVVQADELLRRAEDARAARAEAAAAAKAKMLTVGPRAQAPERERLTFTIRDKANGQTPNGANHG